MARKTDSEIRKDLEGRLARKSTAQEAFGAILATLTLIVLVYLAFAVSGTLAIFAWVLVVSQGLSIIIKSAGWRTIVLTNDEQAYLAKNF